MALTHLQSKLQELEAFEKEYIELGKDIFRPGEVALCTFDLFINAIMDRALSIIFGFTSQIRADNFTCASPLVRMHLDNVLRLYAATLTIDCNEFAKRVLSGQHIRNIEDRLGMKLTDQYLVENLSKEYPWMKNVYMKTSGYVHFSNTHIFNSIRLQNSEINTLAFSISRKDRWVTDEAKLEATRCMIEISQILFKYLLGWNQTKRS